MKKFIKVFSLIIVLLFTITCTSCSTTKNYVEGKKITEIGLTDYLQIETSEKFIGYLYWDEENPEDAVIYRSYLEAVTSDKNKELIYAISSKDSDKFGETYSLPKLASGLSIGTNFKGWFKTDENGNSVRVTTVADLESAGKVHAEYINYAESGLVVLVCMIIVFLMLALLWGIVSLFKYIAPKENEENSETENNSPQVVEPKKKLKLEDITDDDMMAAALVASIDYHNEIKEDVRVV